MLTVMAWYWVQDKSRCVYAPEHVNTWARMIRRHCTMDIRVACVTNDPEGIDDSVAIIQPPGEFEHFRIRHWSQDRGLPQCYRRIAMYAPHAADWIGSERFVSMDLDCIVMGDLNPVFDRGEDIVLFDGTSGTRPYNGSMTMMTAGCRPHVYEHFNEARAAKASRRYLGSDQAWVAYCLGKGEAVFGREHGVVSLSRKAMKAVGENGGMPLDHWRLMFTPGDTKPWHLHQKHPGIAEHYR